MINIAIFASGTGSNAEAIIKYLDGHAQIKVNLIVSNKATAKVLDKAAAHQIKTLVVDRHGFYQTINLLNQLKNHQIELIVLAGFLWLIPEYLVMAFPRQIINIHPALLPKYGGKGMYGHHVHQAVFDHQEKESGITIHYVNQQYDEGQVILQAHCPITPADRPDDIARKVLALEHRFFPTAVEMVALQLNS